MPERTGLRVHLPSERRLLPFVATLAVLVLLAACELMPRKPEAVFTLYREKMKSGMLDEARALLSDRSRRLALELSSEYNLKEAPENLALLNILDPVSPPLIMKETDKYTLLQVRTLKGGLRLIRMVRADRKAPWKIDMSEELKTLRTSLAAGRALEEFRQLAMPFALLLKDFAKQLKKMKAGEPSTEPEPNQEQPGRNR